MATRDKQGRFLKGNGGSPGRKPREYEQRYMDAVKQAVSVSDIKSIFARAVKDAIKGDAQARKFVFDYTVGPPVQKIDGLDSMTFRIVLPEDFPGGQA